MTIINKIKFILIIPLLMGFPEKKQEDWKWWEIFIFYIHLIFCLFMLSLIEE